jgi:hypothetical protein
VSRPSPALAVVAIAAGALVASSVSGPTPTRAGFYHGLMLACRRLAAGFGTAGMRAELAYRDAIAQTSLAD